MKDIADQLDGKRKKPQRADLADWWDADEDDRLLGVVTRIHETKFNDDEEPKSVYTVKSIGECDVPEGEQRSLKTHTQLIAGLQDVEVRDIVDVVYLGYEKSDSGHPANSYEVAVMPEDDWRDSDSAEDIEDLLEDTQVSDDRGKDVVDASGSDDESSNDDDGDEKTDSEDIPEFIEGAMELKDGEMEIEALDKMLNEVRDFGVDVEDTVEDLDEYEIEDGVVKQV